MKPTAILTTIPSDSHNWNLIYMELLLKEQGYFVKNLGACVPFNLTLESCIQYKPEVIIVSTVNGHGFIEGITLIEKIKEYLPPTTQIFIGGKLSTDAIMSSIYSTELELAGYTKAYSGNDDIQDFKSRLQKLAKSSITVKE